MPRKPAIATPAAPARRRRTSQEARSDILNAAEKRLIAAGPAAIRLQEVAADVGVSHPTVLHHFKSREGLVEAVVRRALDSIHAALLAAVLRAPARPDDVEKMLDGVFEAMVNGGHGRAFLWLALSGYVPTVDELRVRSVASAVHEVRRQRWRQAGRRAPSAEDTYFTVLLPALAILSLSVMGHHDDPEEPARFRVWLARLIHHHLEKG